MGVEEMDGENEARCQQRLVTVDDGGDVDEPAGQEMREELREPKHQPGGTDHRDSPEDGRSNRISPSRSTAHTRAGPQVEEPLDMADQFAQIVSIEHQAVGSEEKFTPGLGRHPFLRTRSLRCAAKIPNMRNRRHAVNVSSCLESAQKTGEDGGPPGIGELQGHPGQGQTHEAYDHENVESPMKIGESTVLLSVPMEAIHAFLDVPRVGFHDGLFLS